MIWSRKNKRDGIVYWFVRYDTPSGGRKKEKVPPVFTEGGTVARQATRTDAREFLTQRRAEVIAGTWRDPDAPEPESDRGPTFAAFAERFLREHPGKRRSNHYPSNVKELVKHFGERYLREITRSDLDTYRVLLETTARQGRPIPKRKRIPGGPTHYTRPALTPTTVLKRLRALHRMFRMAVRWGVLESSPAAEMEKPSANKGRVRFLTREEFDRLHDAAAPWVRPMLRFAVSTGMRLSEIATLRWDGVDFDARTLHVEQETKTGARVVPMTEAARAVLEERKAKRKEVARLAGVLSPFVFTADDGADYATEEQRRRISEAARSAAASAELGPHVGFHVTRHTAASWMVQAGVPLFQVQTILGHSTPMLTQRYAHLAPGHLKTATAALDRALGIAPKGESDFARKGPVSVPTRSAEGLS